MFTRIISHSHTRSLLLLLGVLAFIVPVPAYAFAEETVYWIVVSVFGFAVQLGGLILDFGFSRLVVGMGGLLIGGANGTGIGVAIDSLWTVIRDLFNILFILGLIWIGFQTILTVNGSDYKKQLAYLIAAALLINFSLFGAKLIVDIANLSATQIYGQITAELDSASVQNLNDNFSKEGVRFFDINGISAVLMSNLYLQTLFDEDSLESIEKARIKQGITE
ncbi:hypothetical protein N9L26_01960, partial [Candidatus Pacebacteria bacterium]|nr:hypothetical protein [Candidatus Paceibacterota bacterium]